MTTVAIIAARGDSKRLPGKNIKEFCNRPLIAWTIIQARACKAIAEVYVTTDSEEIANVSREYGATVLMREDPRESLDITGGGVPIGVAALRIEKMRSFDAAIELFPTSPLRKTGDLERSIQALEETGKPHGFFTEIKDAFINRKIDSNTCWQFIMSKTGEFLYEIGGYGVAMFKEYYHQYHPGPNTLVDWDDRMTWMETAIGIMQPGPVYYLLLEDWQGHEIDYQSDFDLCEFLFERYLLAEWEAIYEKISKRR